MKWQPIEELNIAEGSRTMFVVKAFDVTVGWLEKYIHTSSPHCVWLGDSGKFMGWSTPAICTNTFLFTS